MKNIAYFWSALVVLFCLCFVIFLFLVPRLYGQDTLVHSIFIGSNGLLFIFWVGFTLVFAFFLCRLIEKKYFPGRESVSLSNILKQLYKQEENKKDQ